MNFFPPSGKVYSEKNRIETDAKIQKMTEIILKIKIKQHIEKGRLKVAKLNYPYGLEHVIS